MKPDDRDLPDLRSAFPPVPASFAARIRETLDRVTDEAPAPRRGFPARTVLITAIIIVSMTAIALALSQIRWQGLDARHGVRMTTATEQALLDARPRHFRMGPLPSTLRKELDAE